MIQEINYENCDHEFETLTSSLRNFRLSVMPLHEKNIELKLGEFLRKKKGFEVEEQKSSRLGRYDIVVKIAGKRYCLELKKIAYTSCAEQLDRYARDFDGLFLVCWKASRNLKAVFGIGKKRASIPIELIEIRSNCEMI